MKPSQHLSDTQEVTLSAFGTSDWSPISAAPRNGLTVLVADPDCGVFAMAWVPTAENPFVGDVMGLWEAPDRSMTWSEHDGCGPTLWKPLPEPAASPQPLFNHDGRALILPTTTQDGPGFELKDRWRR